MTTSPAGLLELAAHPDFDAAVPTPDHFLPLLYLAGLADADGTGCDVLVDGYTYGSLSMISYTLGADCPDRGRRHGCGRGAPGAERRAPGRLARTAKKIGTSR